MDAGCGRSRLVETSQARDFELILIDLSLKMLKHSDGHSGHSILGSAYRLPIADQTVDGLYSFLGDAFGTWEFFRESFRVLKSGGELFYVAPNYEWAVSLRNELGISCDTTRFVSSGETISAPSFVFRGEALKSDLSKAGFSKVRFEHLCLPTEFPRRELPEHILIPSRKLGLDPYRLPIVSLWVATKLGC